MATAEFAHEPEDSGAGSEAAERISNSPNVEHIRETEKEKPYRLPVTSCGNIRGSSMRRLDVGLYQRQEALL